MEEYDEEDLDDALKECYTYNKMGALDRNMIMDIAHDNQVPYEVLLKEFGWE
jgi:hypothetical protein